MNPTVSLLVPVFNRADLLPPCLDSALAQTMGDLEVVVVDGASTDATWDVCLRYAKADPRVRIFRDPTNAGPVRGWWRCVEEALGTYSTFLWSDDLLMPLFLERTVGFLRDDEIAFAYTAAEIGPQPGRGSIHYTQSDGHMTSDAFIAGSLSQGGRYPVSPACALFRLTDLRRNFVKELPTDPPIDLTATGAGVDLLLYLLTASQRPRVAHVPEALAFFRAHGGSISMNGRDGQVALGYAVAKGWFARSSGRRDLAPAILARHWLREMSNSRRIRNPTDAARRYGRLVTPKELVWWAAMSILQMLEGALTRWVRKLVERLIAGG
jgi:glycosyltransferase involved in cell wall biosynthesis